MLILYAFESHCLKNVHVNSLEISMNEIVSDCILKGATGGRWGGCRFMLAHQGKPH